MSEIHRRVHDHCNSLMIQGAFYFVADSFKARVFERKAIARSLLIWGVGSGSMKRGCGRPISTRSLAEAYSNLRAVV